jgi:purine-binding chemotaxis protein CheW
MHPTDEVANQRSLERFVVFELDAEEYAVPIKTVTEVVPYLEVSPVPGAPAYILGLMNLRGKVVPVLDLEKKFNLSRSSDDNRAHIMIAESDQQLLFGILVDYVREVLKVPSEAIKPAPQAIKSNIATEYLGGVIVLGNEQEGAEERIVVVLNLQKILSDTDVEESRAAIKHGQQTTDTPSNEGGTS